MLATKFKPDLSALAVESLSAAGFSATDVAGIIGTTSSLVQVAAGQRRLTRAQMHAIQAATGVSCHVWAIRALDRSGLSPKRKQLVDEAGTVMSQWDGFVAGIDAGQPQNGPPTNGAAKPQRVARKQAA